MDYKLDIDFTKEELEESSAAESEEQGFDGRFENQEESGSSFAGSFDNDNIVSNDDVVEEKTVDHNIERVVIDEEDVVGAPYTSGQFRREQRMNSSIPPELKYGSSEIAKMLGVTEQTVRNYCNSYAEFIGITQTDSSSSNYNRWKLTKEQIEHLRYIIQTKDENKFTTEQMRAYLANPDHSMGAVPESQRLDQAFSLLRQDIHEIVRQAILDSQKELNERAIEDNAHQVDEMRKIIEEQKVLIESLNKNLENAAEEMHKTLNEVSHPATPENDTLQYEGMMKELRESVENMVNKIDAKDLMIDELKDTLKKQQEELEQLREAGSKRKKFFGIF